MTTPPGRTPNLRIAAMDAEHAEQVRAIYLAGVDTGHATFETAVPSWESFVAGKLPGQRHVALDAGDRVIGWVAAGAVSERPVYAGVVEHSVYVAPGARGRGVGTALLEELIASTEAAGIWTIQTGVFPENTTSLALHAHCGFRASASGSASAATAAAGATSSCSNAAASASATEPSTGPTLSGRHLQHRTTITRNL